MPQLGRTPWSGPSPPSPCLPPPTCTAAARLFLLNPLPTLQFVSMGAEGFLKLQHSDNADGMGDLIVSLRVRCLPPETVLRQQRP